MSRVFVTDGRSKASVAIVRSLGKKNIEVTASNDRKINPTFLSKYVKNRVIYPSPEKTPDLFISEMYKLIKKERYEVVIPVRDATTILFSKYKNKFSNFTKMPIPNYEVIMKGRDKAQTVKIAIENGIPCPETYFVDDEDINKMKSNLKYPVLIRPKESSGSRGIVYVDSPEKLMYEYKKVQSQYDGVMIQEYIPHGGEHYSVCALFNQYSEPRASFVYKEIRQYPITGGPATFSESTERLDVLKYTLKLLKAMNWYGVAHADFMIDEGDKKPKLLEINPRFWTSLNLAILSGVDFPYLLYKMAIEGDVKSVNNYQIGVKMRVLPEDILCFLCTPNKFKKLPEFITFNGIGDAILSLDDPCPAVGVILESIISFLSKEQRAHAFNRGWSSQQKNIK